MTLPEILIRDNISKHSELEPQHQPAYLGKVVRNSGCGRKATKRASINPPAVEGFLLGGFIPTCRAQTGVKTAKQEQSMNTISRRQFLKLASGIGLGLAIAPLKLEAASTATLNQVWQQANQTPLLFDVAEYGTLSVADYPEPKIRSDVYAIDSHWNESPATLALAAESCIPLSWFAADLHREAIEQKLDSISESLHELLGCSDATQKIMANIRQSCGDSDCPEVVEEWLSNLKQAEFDSVVQDIDRWLAAEPNWTHECEYFEEWADGQRAALNFFRGIDLDSISGIHIDIVEGEHPGSTYYAAELAMDPEEANTIAAHEGIPLRFRRVL
jgi:hypothetical protein